VKYQNVTVEKMPRTWMDQSVYDYIYGVLGYFPVGRRF